MNLSDKVCVVTGASSGIGRRTALDLAGRGARLCVVARRRERLEQLLAEMGGPDGGHSLFVCDVSDRDQVRSLAAYVEATHKRCDVLINNAGFSADGTFEGPDDVARFQEVVAVNFYGTVYCSAELLPLLLRSRPAGIVNVGSVAGRFGLGGNSSYCASKFAVAGFSESLHLDLAGRGVCVSLIEPGLIPTEGWPQTDFVAHPIMKHALGTVEDVSAAIIDAITKRKIQRVVPRWYYLLQLPRVVTPPLYRWAAGKMAGARSSRRDASARDESPT